MIYQLHIRLLEVQPLIWRQFLVKGDTNMQQLHNIIQIVMGWYDMHLWILYIQGMQFGHALGQTGNSEEMTLADMKLRKGNSFDYEYDFGDRWEHQIIVEDIFEPQPLKRYPACIAGKRACPPEDCGGSWSYMHVMDVLKKRRGRDYRAIREHAGKDFNPAVFKRTPINAQLRSGEWK